MDVKKRLIRTLTLCLIGLVIGVTIAFYQISTEKSAIIQTKSDTNTNSAPMPGIQLGGPFSLTDHTGKAVTEKDYESQYKLIYFGFTFCPAICPTELQKITQALKLLPPENASRLQPLFITLDPERDSVKVMQDYVKLFHPDLVGLTGTPEQIEAIKKNYRIFATKVQDENMSDYTIDHSTFIYLVSPDNKVLSMYRMKDDAAYIAQDISTILSGA
jgi:protein SCO1/2